MLYPCIRLGLEEKSILTGQCRPMPMKKSFDNQFDLKPILKFLNQ